MEREQQSYPVTVRRATESFCEADIHEIDFALLRSLKRLFFSSFCVKGAMSVSCMSFLNLFDQVQCFIG